MSARNDDELGAVIYTALLDISEPSNVSEICDKVAGLRRREAQVAELLRTMCDNDMVVNVGGRYILQEKLGQDSANLSFDGPAHGTTCTIGQRMGVNVQSRPPSGATGENTVAQASREVVPVQQSIVSRSSSSDSTCDTEALQSYREILRKIMDFLQQSHSPVKAKDIAQGTGIGKARSDVNRYLYLLKEHNFLLNIGGTTEWQIKREMKKEDLQVCAAQLAKKPLGKSKGKQSAGSPNSVCECPNAGPNCVHVSNNFQQNVHHHHYNYQFGEHNQMISGPPPEREPPEGHL